MTDPSTHLATAPTKCLLPQSDARSADLFAIMIDATDERNSA